MRKRGATMVVLAACLAAFIGTVAPSTASSAGRIEGVVVQDENGQPLAGLCVFLTFANDSLVRHRTETASDGSYAFTGLASDDYKVGYTCRTTEQETWVQRLDRSDLTPRGATSYYGVVQSTSEIRAEQSGRAGSDPQPKP